MDSGENRNQHGFNKREPGAGGEQRWCLAEELVKTPVESLSDAVDNLSGFTPGTLQDVTR